MTAILPATEPAAATTLLTHALTKPSETRSLRDLVTAVDAGAAWLADPAAARAALHDGHNPPLYHAWRDVVPARTTPAADGPVRWHADLVLYPGAVPAPGTAEPPRSIGHWNTRTQVEVFQVLTGRVLMLHTNLVDGTPVLAWRSCGPGEHVHVPPGAWHLTVAEHAPAAVFNIYTGAEPPGTATPAELPKYHRAAPPRLGVTITGDQLSLATDPSHPSTWPVQHLSASPDWAAPLTDPHGLATLYLECDDTALSALHDQTLRHSDHTAWER
ncbi:hypothetical protein C8D87_11434 [Lentzea atacamensis]|uniref:Glucose-6-phosphate isomerase n=1 Tax=Lentzea atacamensis TaxID=531938 RepID=A0ABX9DWE3_9PSEU|nr:hypothetical protein [Lentzea atacamensis]RAS59422.1 hypothetical protein C8D87_11434 [Lentzea atacamensis]